MKKILIAMTVILVFAGYIVYQKITGSATQVTPGIPSGSSYKDGIYTGSVEDAFYGNVQVQATIASGKITNVSFLQHPGDRGRSILINSYAMPILSQEAVMSQSANVNAVSGASATSQAFTSSLASALSQAK